LPDITMHNKHDNVQGKNLNCFEIKESDFKDLSKLISIIVPAGKAEYDKKLKEGLIYYIFKQNCWITVEK